MVAPARSSPPAYRVFSQRRETTLDVPACSAQALRFFDAALAMNATGDQLVLTSAGGPAARSIRARAVTPADLALAAEGEARAGGGGLSGLAGRCATLWEVSRHGEPDREALLIAAIPAPAAEGVCA